MSVAPTIMGPERRHYRIPSIIPVEYQLLSADNKPLDQEIRTAFTRDLSEGGLCLQLRRWPAGLEDQVKGDATELGVLVDLVLPTRALRVMGQVVWHHDTDTEHWLGIEFEQLGEEDAAAITTFARRSALRPKLMMGAGIALSTLLIVGAILILWTHQRHDVAIERSQLAVSEAQKNYVVAANRLRDLRTELQWLAVQLGDSVTEIADTQEADGAHSREIDVAIDELAKHIERLKAVVDRPQHAAHQQE